MQYSRRKFLKTLAVTASGAFASSLVVGCGGGSSSRVEVETPTPILIDETGQFFPQSVASGDPRPDSVIVWTRAVKNDANVPLILQVSTSDTFSTVVVEFEALAEVAADGCVKVRVMGLNEDTTYYYRFLINNGDSIESSRIGRTKTAPTDSNARAIKFAYASCQDYIGRYYNNYLSILEQDDLDFVVHLGDYIYETTGDSSFQSGGEDRSIVFDDAEGALTIGVGDNQFQAAASLDNYRQLYKTYRSDALLRQVHERFPMIVIWDDHEFSDDSWQDNGTYLDGTADEQNLARKRHSEQAFFEYIPIDHEALHMEPEADSDALAVSEQHLFPNTRIYRDFRFGQHLHLVMSDYRTYRPDHLIPEDAFPGTVAMDQTTLTQFLTAAGRAQPEIDAIIGSLSPYVDIDLPPFAPYKAAFTEIFTGLYASDLAAKLPLSQADALTQAQQRAVDAIQGKLATTYLNIVLGTAKAQLPAEHPIQALPALPESGVEQGIAYYSLGKTNLFADIGARYVVIKETYDLFAAYREFVENQQGATAQNAFATEQTNWIAQTFATSDATWKMLGSSVSFSSLLFDLSANRPFSGSVPLESALDSDVLPAALRQRFYINVDHWDGAPQFKSGFINDVLARNGVITLGGDIHSTYVTEHAADATTGNKSFNFTVASVSSGTFGSFLTQGLNDIFAQLGDVPDAVNQLPSFFNIMVRTATQRNDVPDTLKFADMWQHGVGIVSVSEEQVEVEFHNVNSEVNGESTVAVSYYDNPHAYLNMVQVHKFKIANNQLEQLS
ncbi:alkaline phosphatase D family protein [Alteromonas sp. a30]|uniref:alkaline phosphatase D family protein n=1 Tax=Alteromonas sp. a30 TaxID=2730917 RepID=UPI002280CBCD|nr:alkaline phosphatase D family protein [Alteromonas sp. a30]MCY7297116.1 metallophosphatase [Alteromonas sp. a30]